MRIAVGSLLLAAVFCCIPATGAQSPPRYTNTWAVEVEGGKRMADAVAAKYGFVNKGSVGSLKDMYEFALPEGAYVQEHDNTVAAVQVTETLIREHPVKFAQQQVEQRMVRKGYSPPTDPKWSSQWQLVSPRLQVERAWIQGYTGCGVTVGVLDDGVDYNNEDLKKNYLSDLDLNANDNSGDAFPKKDSAGKLNSHGTNCAGVIAMEKSNEQCGAGVAYNSKVTGVLLGDSTTDVTESRAFSHKREKIDIYSNSWGPPDNGCSIGRPGSLSQKAFREGVTEGRDKKGSIFLFAAGNGGESSDSCAADGYNQDIHTISIGSLSSQSRPSSYDEKCSAKMASTFVDTPGNRDKATVATGVNGQCVTNFDGTSAATPEAAGAIALALQANSKLTWRDVQYLIAYTSNPDIVTVDDLATNAAGLKFSHSFGFGAIDAEALVTRARHWETVSEQKTSSIAIDDLSITSQSAVMTTITVPSGTISYLEHVILQVSTEFSGSHPDLIYNDCCEHIRDGESTECSALEQEYYYEPRYSSNKPGRGDIQIELSSQKDTKSIVLPYRPKDTLPKTYDSWEFMSVHFWGEKPTGHWHLTVRNNASEGTVKVTNMKLTFYGTSSAPKAVSKECHSSCSRGCAGPGADKCDACRKLRVASTLKCVDQCPQGTTARNGYCYNQSEAEKQCTGSSSVLAFAEACTDRCGRWMSFRARLACMANCKK